MQSSKTDPNGQAGDQGGVKHVLSSAQKGGFLDRPPATPALDAIDKALRAGDTASAVRVYYANLDDVRRESAAKLSFLSLLGLKDESNASEALQ